MEKLQLEQGFADELKKLSGELKEPVTLALPGVFNVQLVPNNQFPASVFVNGKFIAYSSSWSYLALTVLAKMLDTVKPTARVTLRLRVKRMISYTSNEIEAASWE